MNPLVSVITSTHYRHDTLLNRCIPSVKKQTYKNIEHIIVSDGEDKELRKLLKKENVSFYELGHNWGSLTAGQSVGAIPRAVGAYLAKGEYIAYLDDDDEYLSTHIEDLMNLILSKDLDFAYSQMQRFWSDGRGSDVIGNGLIVYGCVGTPMIIHKTSLLAKTQWKLEGYGEDFALYKGFVDQGAKWEFLPKITSYYHKQV